MTRRVALALLVLSALVAAPATASALTSGSPIEQAANALRSNNVYVDPSAERAISPSQAGELRRRIEEKDAGPTYVAILPSSVLDSEGGSPDRVVYDLGETLRQPGTYAVVVGDRFRAASTVLKKGVAGELAREALDRQRGAGTTPVLEAFVDLVGDARRNGGSPSKDKNDPGSGGAAALGLLALLGGGAGLLIWRSRRRRRRKEAEQAEELRETAREDLVALGDDIRALDLDVEMPGADAQAKEDYGVAVERYQRAERLLDRARSPQAFGAVSQALEEGRYAMASAKARLAGRQPPERRPPCFFDPRHGPSTRDVPWSPDGYEPRPVPACEADAVRVESGQAPMTREIVSGGRRVALYDAPAYYGPYAGGFFGGFSGFLPGLLFGELLSGGFGGWGGWGDGDSDSSVGDFGFGGGGDFGGGDFGGGFGAGDFGGGDLGGGDFGGGDF